MEPFFLAVLAPFFVHTRVASSLHQISFFPLISSLLHQHIIVPNASSFTPLYPRNVPSPSTNFWLQPHTCATILVLHLLVVCILLVYLILVFQMPVNLTLEPQLSFFEFYVRIHAFVPAACIHIQTQTHTPTCILKYYLVLFSQQVNITHPYIPSEASSL